MASDQNEEKKSSADGLTRKEFLDSVVKRAAIAGAIVAAPKIVDKFLVPPAQAANSKTTGPPPNHNTDIG